MCCELRKRGTSDTHAISLPATIALTIGTACWVIYGIARGDGPVIGANAISFALTFTIMGLKLRYG
jgi:MtN3 and saliva related transmembrane protein